MKQQLTIILAMTLIFACCGKTPTDEADTYKITNCSNIQKSIKKYESTHNPKYLQTIEYLKQTKEHCQ